MRKIVLFTGSRAEYGLAQPIIRELKQDTFFKTHVIASGSHLSSFFGKTILEIKKDGIAKVLTIGVKGSFSFRQVDWSLIYSKIVREGDRMLARLKPDVALLLGDRYETFAMAVAAFYSSIPIAHVFGGDLSQGGHVDDSARHAITKLSHLHFASNKDSAKRVRALGEESWRVFNVGSTSLDHVKQAEYDPPEEVFQKLRLDEKKPVILFTQHPVTTEKESAYTQARESLAALKDLDAQVVITYPGGDPGSERIVRAIEEYRKEPNFRIRRNLGWKLYLGCMRISSCVVGNSSSGLIETPAFKVPCVNIGSRQNGRLRAQNVLDVGYDRHEIRRALWKALKDKDLKRRIQNCVNPYGSGDAAKRIVKILKSVSLGPRLLRKKMTY